MSQLEDQNTVVNEEPVLPSSDEGHIAIEKGTQENIIVRRKTPKLHEDIFRQPKELK